MLTNLCLAMENRVRSSIAYLSGIFVVSTALILGGCSSGNLTGPKVDDTPEETVETTTQQGSPDTMNDEGTGGMADHNTSPED